LRQGGIALIHSAPTGENLLIETLHRLRFETQKKGARRLGSSGNRIG